VTLEEPTSRLLAGTERSTNGVRGSVDPGFSRKSL
jgi:hypothetical protein